MISRSTALRFVIAALLVSAAAAMFTACSGKKNTAARRQYTAFITRYNVYYNGETQYKETLADMEYKSEDDYS